MIAARSLLHHLLALFVHRPRVLLQLVEAILAEEGVLGSEEADEVGKLIETNVVAAVDHDLQLREYGARGQLAEDGVDVGIVFAWDAAKVELVESPLSHIPELCPDRLIIDHSAVGGREQRRDLVRTGGEGESAVRVVVEGIAVDLVAELLREDLADLRPGAARGRLIVLDVGGGGKEALALARSRCG